MKKTYKSRGAFIRNSIIKDLLHLHGMREAQEVIVSGTSAGGLAVLLGLDHIAQIIHTASPETVVGGIVDAGYFPAYKSSRKNYDFNMRQSFNFLNMSAGADIKCTAVADVLSDCAFASNLIPRIHTPHFLMQSRFDKWQIVNELGLGADSTDIVNMYGNFVMTSIFKTVEKNSKATLFLDSCTHHVVIPNTNLASTIIDGKGVAVTDSLRGGCGNLVGITVTPLIFLKFGVKYSYTLAVTAVSINLLHSLLIRNFGVHDADST
eukprot:CAMPEP_0185022502 /NCGR_PEP_ID=MMETSP1103-20130426/5211_1 /TAXON_ID=36769 /ORGANISM="Paraphysomonas bandaiensis, Strain Caron Lab Isolate" /LENGTH=263 /DNA_ID=CAMNT_0027554599 /DNA_START=472 /DNA_END=1260 /DNA_ORIENTATION=+